MSVVSGEGIGASDAVEQLIQCYNKGCGIKFHANSNGPDACTFHPGPPYFHDAYKIWNCCQKKSTDFGTWLSYKGCARGPHNPEKPEDMVRVASTKEIRPEKEDEVIVWNGLNQPTARDENDVSRTFVNLKVDVTPGAAEAIRKFKEQQNMSSEAADALRIGTPCRNSGCDKIFSGPESSQSVCVHHPGTAVFHEGMKYWNCCQKKTSDFTAFLEQKGCEKGTHDFTKNEKVDKLREDWFSSNGNVTVNLYCKGALPDEIRVSCDGLVLTVRLIHGFGDKKTELSYELFGEIVTDESIVRVGERKVELVLKQKEVASWPRLRFESAEEQKEKEES